MCGFAAVIGLRGQSVDGTIARRMAGVLRHRGPDDDGSYASGPVAFGFRRLSILDLSPSGHQPLISDDGDLVIVFNGEIYNYVELRAELIERGHRFRSSGDTEVLLHAYEEWGRDCLPRLNGMWAFLIYDRRRQLVFGSRDRFGVKPLYRYDAGDQVLFASEIKAFSASGLYSPRPNWRRVADLLCRGDHSIPPGGRETFHEGITQIPAGSAFEVRVDGRITEWHFWSLGEVSREPVADPAAEFLGLFEDSVRLRMRSDVPVGVSLSGGLDSTSIVGAMARFLDTTCEPRAAGSLKAFSYVSPQFDESRYIDDTIAATGAEAYRIDVDPSGLSDRLDEVLWYHDEPLHSATALIGYEIYRLAAANGVKVVLSGQGADETLAGYPSYFHDYWCQLVGRGAIRSAWREIGAHVSAHGGDQPSTLRQVLGRSTRERLRGLPGLRSVAHWRQRVRPMHRWFTGDLAAALPARDVEAKASSLDTVLRSSVEFGTLPLYLRIEDRNSMAHSVEARLPFLDYRLVSLAFRLAPEWKLRGPWNKWVLREAMKGRIPESVRTRLDKMGFPTSVAQWFRGPLYEVLQDSLASESARGRGIYNIAEIRADLERHYRGEVDLGSALFSVAQVERWIELPQRRRSNVGVGPGAF